VLPGGAPGGLLEPAVELGEVVPGSVLVVDQRVQRAKTNQRRKSRLAREHY
jgi:hypothetical protein